MTRPFAHVWDRALTYGQFVKESKEHCDLWTGVYRTARLPEWASRRTGEPGRSFKLVAIVEDWCGDASSTVLTNGVRSIPIVIVLTDDMQEAGHWGPRPSELQAFVMEQRQTRKSSQYYPEVRRWYAKDGGETTLREILDIMARAAAG